MYKATTTGLAQRAAFLGLFMDFHTAFKQSNYHTEILEMARQAHHQGYIFHRKEYSYQGNEVTIFRGLGHGLLSRISWEIKLKTLGLWIFSLNDEHYSLEWNGKTFLTKDSNSFVELPEKDFTELLTTLQRVLRLYLKKNKIRIPILLRY